MARNGVLPAEGEVPDLIPGPGSVAWRLSSDARIMSTAGYALMLQVAHPTVGAGVHEHSNFEADPWGRLLRTLDYTTVMVYGRPELAGRDGQAHPRDAQAHQGHEAKRRALLRPRARGLRVGARDARPVDRRR